MPFYTPSNKPQFNINFDRYKPIQVISYCDTDGNIKPLQFKYENDDYVMASFNIDSIKYSKELSYGILYRCLFTNHGRRQEVNMVYFIREHLWCLGK